MPTAPLRFEPSEVIGLARIPLTQRNPIAAVDVDNSGTTDIVVIALIDVPSSTGTSTIKTPGINVLKNRATSGVHRVSLDGTNTVSNLDFATFSTATRPSFNALSNPNPVPEDVGTQTLSITGVTGATGLVFSAASSNPSVVPNPNVNYTGGTNPATLSYQPIAKRFWYRHYHGPSDQPGKWFHTRCRRLRTLVYDYRITRQRSTYGGFSFGRTVTRNEDAGAQTVAGFVNGITVGGGAFEAAQVLQPLTVTAANPSLFQVQPAIDATGRLTFTGAPNAAGTSIVTLTVKDNGGNADGGSERSSSNLRSRLPPSTMRRRFRISVIARCNAGLPLKQSTALPLTFNAVAEPMKLRKRSRALVSSPIIQLSSPLPRRLARPAC